MLTVDLSTRLVLAERIDPLLADLEEEDKLVTPVDTGLGHNATVVPHNYVGHSMSAQVELQGGAFYTALVINKDMIDFSLMEDLRSIVDMVVEQKGLPNIVVWSATSLDLHNEPIPGKVPPGAIWWNLKIHVNLEGTEDPDLPLFLSASWYFSPTGFNFFHVGLALDEPPEGIPKDERSSFWRYIPGISHYLRYLDRKEDELLVTLTSKARFPERCIGVWGVNHKVRVDGILHDYPNVGFVLTWTPVGETLKPFPAAEVMSKLRGLQGPIISAWGSGAATILADSPTKGSAGSMALSLLWNTVQTPGEDWLNYLLKKSGAARNAHIPGAEYTEVGGGTTESLSGWIMQSSYNGFAHDLFTEEEIKQKVGLKEKPPPNPALAGKIVMKDAGECGR